jgi:nucleotide-binding universal stress UspA family protein
MAYTSIVCGVTGSPHSQKAALEAAALAKQDNARLTFVYAVDVEFLKGSIGGMSVGLAEDGLEHLGTHILDHAEQLAESHGVTPKKVIRRGDPLKVLKEVVLEEKGDLLVIGDEDRSFFDKVLFDGSVEEHVAELKQQTGTEVKVIR